MLRNGLNIPLVSSLENEISIISQAPTIEGVAGSFGAAASSVDVCFGWQLNNNTAIARYKMFRFMIRLFWL